MARIEYEEIKARHAAAFPKLNSEIIISDKGEVSVAGDEATLEFMVNAHDDMDALIKEHDRFVSNYKLALEFFDNFMNHYANVLPPEEADEARDVRVRMRGLL